MTASLWTPPRHRFAEALARYRHFCAGIRTDTAEFYCQSQWLFTHLAGEATSQPSYARRFAAHSARLALAVRSLVTVMRLGRGAFDTAHYMIEPAGAGYDVRSQYILDILKPDSTVNFFHTGSVLRSLRHHRRENAVYFAELADSIAQRRSLATWNAMESEWAGHELQTFRDLLVAYGKLVCRSGKRIAVYRWLIRALGIKRFVFLDDARHAPELLIACQQEGVKTCAYMHARFNECFVGLQHATFDRYIVWSEYFREKLLQMNPRYQRDQIVVCGHPRAAAAAPQRRGAPPYRVLLLGESNVPDRELTPFWDVLADMREISVFYRPKPGTVQAALGRHRLAASMHVDSEGSIFDTLSRQAIDLVIATHSTVLMESWRVGVPSIVLNSSYDLAHDLVREHLVEFCERPEDLPRCLANSVALTAQQVSDRSALIWGEQPLYQQGAVIAALSQPT